MIVGIGTDIVSISRISEAMAKFGIAFAERILNKTELAEFLATKNQSQFLAKRFAAKEAIVKAIGTGMRAPLTHQNVSVSHDDQGKPIIVFAIECNELLNTLGVTRHHITISDEQEYAVAFVILER